MTKQKPKNGRRKNKLAQPAREEDLTMTISVQDLQAKLDAAVKAATDETTAVDSTEAALSTLRQQVADLMAAAPSLDAAAASVDQLLAAQAANSAKLTAGLAANVTTNNVP
jgi:hypothetical protein